MSGFHDVRFPFHLSLGARGQIERRTEIVSLKSGAEERNSPWAHGRRRWDVGAALKTRSDGDQLIAFFEARRGPLHAFRFRDPLDDRADNMLLGVGDGVRTTFQLIKTYNSGAYGYARPIALPVVESVALWVGGTPITPSIEAGGVISLVSAPAPGEDVRASFQFDVPVRFESERLALSLAHPGHVEAGSIGLIEVRL